VGLALLATALLWSLGAAYLRALNPSIDSLLRLPEASLAPRGAVLVRQERSASGYMFGWYLLKHYETTVPPRFVLFYYETHLSERGWSVSIPAPPAPDDHISACRGDSAMDASIDPATTTELTRFYVQLSPVIFFGCGVRGPPSPELIAFVVVASFSMFMLVAQISRWRGRARRGPTERTEGGIADWAAMFFWVPYAVVALRIGPELDVPESLRWIGLLLTVAGVLFGIRAVLVLGRHYDLELEVHQDHELVRRGPYRLVRHPVYTGLALHLIGACLATGNALLIVGTLLIVLPVFYLRSRAEERLLRERFGPAYDAYARDVGMLVPLL
jgi:protein-S-isoprenylcysteine O-methyltransferase Ste14